MGGPKSGWLALAAALAVASLSASAAISLYFRKSKSNLSTEEAAKKIQQLETSLKNALKKCAAERQGRIRAQKALREPLSGSNAEKLESISYPMAPIAIVHSCFSTRNGTPRQPLLVPLARATLVFDSTRIPQASLEGLEGYSHCWILYVFHLNTNLDKLRKRPSHSTFKAKVRVPRLEGEKVGVFATRSPHRACPIGLTVAKVEAVHGRTVHLSGVDLVDGSPVLDIKPYLPYCDSVQGAKTPDWLKVDENLLGVASVNFSDDFPSSLADCWLLVGEKSLYASPEEYRDLIKQVLSWDIRSLAQRNRPHQPIGYTGSANLTEDALTAENCQEEEEEEEAIENGGGDSSPTSSVLYHLFLEGLDVSYRIDSNADVLVEKVSLPSVSFTSYG
ncbi:hypothetical protein ABFS82_11G027300 [Erythranthe guttata]|nr:PREDICTED: uncharacterized protein LOC105961374 [Erythranthe guttata]|eukprot:XP_012841054.1 PREDICTED: uncharacterized protein LOC105961374 [Erythranthe guttata]